MDLVRPQPHEWRERFLTHKARILTALPGAHVQHIGSTAIPNIQAKDVVDVLIGVPAEEIQHAVTSVVKLSYVKEGAKERHWWFCWPHPREREAVLHIAELNGDVWRKRLAFRNQLRENPELAREYEALKLRIAARTDNWSEYTQQKAAFVAHIVDQG